MTKATEVDDHNALRTALENEPPSLRAVIGDRLKQFYLVGFSSAESFALRAKLKRLQQEREALIAHIRDVIKVADVVGSATTDHDEEVSCNAMSLIGTTLINDIEQLAHHKYLPEGGE
jgi:hypothetical protein